MSNIEEALKSLKIFAYSLRAIPGYNNSLPIEKYIKVLASIEKQTGNERETLILDIITPYIDIVDKYFKSIRVEDLSFLEENVIEAKYNTGIFLPISECYTSIIQNSNISNSNKLDQFTGSFYLLLEAVTVDAEKKRYLTTISNEFKQDVNSTQLATVAVTSAATGFAMAQSGGVMTEELRQKISNLVSGVDQNKITNAISSVKEAFAPFQPAYKNVSTKASNAFKTIELDANGLPTSIDSVGQSLGSIFNDQEVTKTVSVVFQELTKPDGPIASIMQAFSNSTIGATTNTNGINTNGINTSSSNLTHL